MGPTILEAELWTQLFINHTNEQNVKYTYFMDHILSLEQ